MFIHDFTYMDYPADVIRDHLRTVRTPRLETLAADAEQKSEKLFVRVGSEHSRVKIAKAVRIVTDTVYERNGITILPLQWSAIGATRLFPSMEADIEVAPVGPAVTQLTFLGRYTPPLGALGRTIDSLVFHRVAEATVRNFLQSVRTELERGLVPVEGNSPGESRPA